jgi:hypothetical protein
MGKLITMQASGTFIVKITPMPVEENVGDPSIGCMSLHKEFQGDLEATAHGQMLATSTGVEGSAAYVALDRVTGALRGRNGSFSLAHRGVMNRGTPELSICVVPDSGTNELEGLTGTLSIRIEDGKHFYDMEFSLPAPTL